MFCKNCGKEIDDKAVVCPNCGVMVAQPEVKKEMCTLAIVGFVLSLFTALIGMICSIIAYRKCKAENLDGSGFALAGIIIGAAEMVIYIIVIASVSCLAASIASTLV